MLATSKIFDSIFTATDPWNFFGFDYSIFQKEAKLAILPIPMLTITDFKSFLRSPKVPDLTTLRYWLMKIDLLIKKDLKNEIICVFVNRTGTEPTGTEGQADSFAGTSAVIGIKGGVVNFYGILGRYTSSLLVADTETPLGPKTAQDLMSIALSSEKSLPLYQSISSAAKYTYPNDNKLKDPVSLRPPQKHYAPKGHTPKLEEEISRPRSPKIVRKGLASTTRRSSSAPPNALEKFHRSQGP